MSPIDHPCVWKGGELLAREDWRRELTAGDLAELAAALAETRDLPLEELNPASFSLPALGKKLAAIQHDLEHRSGACLLQGLPIEKFDAKEAERVFWGLASHIGSPVPQTAAGDRLFHVRDEGFAADHPQARGPSSKKRLSFHTDRCDVIAFLCLRQAKSGGENYVVSSAALFNETFRRRPELAEVLMRPYRYQRHNIDPGNEHPYYEQPVFSFREGHFAANLLRVLIERAYAAPGSGPMQPIQREALDYLEELAEDPQLHVSFRQLPGDIVLLNNFVTLHRRSEFEDHAEKQKRRHLLRLWLSVPNSRPLDPRLAPGYGPTAAGAVRGGMRPE